MCPFEEMRDGLLKLVMDSGTLEGKARPESLGTQLRAQGLGRHTDAEVTEIGQENLSALSSFLGQWGRGPGSHLPRLYPYLQFSVSCA